MNKIAAIAVLLFIPFTANADPGRHWFQSKKFWIGFSISTAAMFADYETSQRAFSRGGIESDPVFFSRQPSFGRMTAIGLPLNFAYNYAGFRMSQSKHKIIRDAWWIPSAYQTEFHLRHAVENGSVCVPVTLACQSNRPGPISLSGAR